MERRRQTNILIGGRVDAASDRHFHGQIALLRVYSGDVGCEEDLNIPLLHITNPNHVASLHCNV